MIPEISKLNWSYEKPERKEVDGKKIIIEYIAGNGKRIEVRDNLEMSELSYGNWFDDDFVRYAILDLSEPEPEPLPYKGELPKIITYKSLLTGEITFWAEWNYNHEGGEKHILRDCPDRRTAILEWNEFVRKMES